MALLASFGMSAQYSHTIQAEKLDRGVVAVKTDKGVFVSWRSLVSDDKAMAFDVYRDNVKINETPLKSKTNFTDAAGTAGAKYTVKAVVDNNVVETSKEAAVWETPYMRIHIDRPEGGKSPAGAGKDKNGVSYEQRDYTYTPDDISVADVDGDGEWELIVKWFPTNAADNSQERFTGNTIIDCYKLDGTQLWRIDLGVNIRSGNHYTQFMVYDFDGDGKAELICKTAPGTKDGNGKNVILGNDDPTKDYRNSVGTPLSGPEYLTVFNGATGAEIHTIAYNPPRTIKAQNKNSSGWGDSYGGRSERYLACVAYLDGVKPSAVFCRGYYTHAYVWAVDFDGTQLKERWLHKSESKGSKSLYGQGTHSITVGDVDADGKDEIIFGAAALDDNGEVMYSTGLGHGDALHLTHMLPDREGLQVFMPQEEYKTAKYSTHLRDAKTGEIICGDLQVGKDIGRGLAANVSARYRGYEFWSSTGTVWGDQAVIKGAKRPSVNFRVYWDGDLLDELLDGTKITKPNDAMTSIATLVDFSQYSNAASCNTTKATPNIQADLFGDWREEVILHDGSTESDLLIFTTTIPSDYKVPCLMQDRQYREAIAWQNCAYNQPPHLSYNLEELFNTKGAVALTSGALNQVIYLGDEIQAIEFTVKRATGVEATNLPEGLTLEFDPATLTGRIYGKIAAAGEFTYTLTTTGAAEGENTTIEGTFVVRPNTAIQLAAHYPFETAGEMVKNEINPEGATSKVTNTMNTALGEAVEGKIGNALLLNGTSCYVQKPYELIDFADNSFSIEFWVNSTASNGTFYILHKGSHSANAATGATGNWMGIEYKNNELRFAIKDGTNKTQLGWSEGSKVFDGQWHHIVAVRDVPAKTLFLYADGELVQTMEDTSGAINCPNENFVIGNVNVGFDNPFKGMLDELSIYRGAMSASKVKEHFQATSAEYLAYFPMDEIGDTTPNKVFGEATARGDNMILSIDGKRSGAIELDGTNSLTQPMYDKINMGEGDFTAEAWVKTADEDGYIFCIGSHNTTNVAGGTGNWIGLEVKNGTAFAIDDNVTKSDCKGAAINDGEWHHVACVRDFAGKTIRLYIDGEEAASKTGVATGAINCSASELLYIGADDEAGRNLAGAIDEFVIYPKALSADEIAEHYQLYRLSEIEDIIAGGANARYTVVDAMSGMVVRTAVGADRIDIVDGLAQGIYILVVENGEKVENFKFIKR